MTLNCLIIFKKPFKTVTLSVQRDLKQLLMKLLWVVCFYYAYKISWVREILLFYKLFFFQRCFLFLIFRNNIIWESVSSSIELDISGSDLYQSYCVKCSCKSSFFSLWENYVLIFCVCEADLKNPDPATQPSPARERALGSGRTGHQHRLSVWFVLSPG